MGCPRTTRPPDVPPHGLAGCPLALAHDLVLRHAGSGRSKVLVPRRPTRPNPDHPSLVPLDALAALRRTLCHKGLQPWITTRSGNLWREPPNQRGPAGHARLCGMSPCRQCEFHVDRWPDGGECQSPTWTMRWQIRLSESLVVSASGDSPAADHLAQPHPVAGDE